MKNYRGFSIIELMVALAIGLMISLSAASLAVSFDVSKRQGVSANSAIGNATLSFSALTSSIAEAGLGLISNSGLSCGNLNAAYQNVAAANSEPLPFLSISREAGAISDSITIAYGTDTKASSLLKAAGTQININDPVTVPGNNSIASGDLVLLTTGGASSVCTLRQVTSITPNGKLSSLGFGGSEYNTPPGFFSGETGYTNFYVIPLGQFVYQQWSVSGNVLQVRNLMTRTNSMVTDAVVALRAQYGITDGSSGALAGWVDATNDWATLDVFHLTRIRSVRVALVVRDGYRERGAASACSSTTNPEVSLPEWNETVDVSSLKDWQCYRYKAYSAVIPLRNIVWGLAA
jgi:type IV pilus assembly protein PilW